MLRRFLISSFIFSVVILFCGVSSYASDISFDNPTYPEIESNETIADVSENDVSYNDVSENDIIVPYDVNTPDQTDYSEYFDSIIELEEHILSTLQMILGTYIFFQGIMFFRRFRKGAFLQR